LKDTGSGHMWGPVGTEGSGADRPEYDYRRTDDLNGKERQRQRSLGGKGK